MNRMSMNTHVCRGESLGWRQRPVVRLCLMIGTLIVTSLIAAAVARAADGQPRENASAEHSVETDTQPRKQDEHKGKQHKDHDEHAHNEGEAHDEHARDAGEAHDEHADDAGEAHDEHAREGHAHNEGEALDEHAGHDHASETVRLSADERRNADLTVAEAGPGSLGKEIRLPGEVVLNDDSVAHVVPLVSGVAKEVHVTVGDTVEAGDVLALLDSAELGEAKLDYLNKTNEVQRRAMLVPRAKAVHDNTLRLLAFLDKRPALDDLQSFDTKEIGDNLRALLNSYAELFSARQTFEREKGLYEKKIASEEDYLAAKTAHEKAAAAYLASRDSIAFDVKRHLFDTEAAMRASQFEARTAEQRLRIMGLPEDDIHALDRLVGAVRSCPDPTCAACQRGDADATVDHAFGNGFSRYAIRSPLSGVIVSKHLVRGERVGEGTDVFTVADNRTVWVNLTVFLKDLDAIAVGNEVRIRAEHSGRMTRGRVAMISPTVDEETRTASARVVLSNEDGSWRPGVFVVGHIAVSADHVPVVVPKHAVQTVGEEAVVFIPGSDGGFEPVPVTTGRFDRTKVEITSGLSAGSRYVVEGAFELKAKLVTSSLGSHAGHGH